jgi:hypothetical protein
MLSKTSVLLKERARRIAAMPRHDLKNGMRNSFYADKQRTTLPNKKKSMMLCKKTLKKYTDVPQDTKRRLKKEWTDEAAAHRRGGARRWPIWVVQLICELLVNRKCTRHCMAKLRKRYHR